MRSDAIHPFGNNPHWSESHYLSFYDRTRDVCGFMRVDLKPNRSLKEMFCYFMMPDGSLVGLKDSTPFDGPRLAAKGLRFEVLEPDRLWRTSFTGGMERTTERKAKKSHVELDLRFEALNDVFDYRSCRTERQEQSDGEIMSERLQQFGTVKGRLSTGLDDFELDALGVQERSWGARDRTVPKGWTCLTSQFSESHAFSLTRRATESGVTDEGFVFQDGKNIPVSKADLNVNMDFGKNPMSFDMTLHDHDGGAHRVFGSVLKRTILQFKSPDANVVSSVNETLSRYNTAGKNGYGIAEFLSKVE